MLGRRTGGGWLLLRGVLGHLSLEQGDAKSLGGQVRLLMGCPYTDESWFVLSGGLSVPHLDYGLGRAGITAVLGSLTPAFCSPGRRLGLRTDRPHRTSPQTA